jgi:hypothetical protein
MAELDIDIDCLDDFMDVIEKDLKIESLLVDLDLELDLEATSIYFNVSAIPKSLYEPIPYVHKVSFIFLALDMGLFDNNYREDVHRRNSKVVRDRKAAWDFILTWSDALFHRQFFIAKVDFLPLCEKLKNNYPGTHATGFQNYTYACSAARLSKKWTNNDGNQVSYNTSLASRSLCIGYDLVRGADSVSGSYIQLRCTTTQHCIPG